MDEKHESKKLVGAVPEKPKSGLPATRMTGTSAARYFEDPFAVMTEFDRYFDNVRRNMESLVLPTVSLWNAPGSGGWLPARLSARAGIDELPARCDLREEPKEYLLTAELPGFAKEDLTVEVTQNGIEVRAEKEEKAEAKREGYLAHERGYTTVSRAFAFPEDVLPENVEAELRDGVLTVRIPKAHPNDVKKTKVRVK